MKIKQLIKKDTLYFDIEERILRLGNKNEGIIFSEPACLVFDNHLQEVVAYGVQAKKMEGRLPKNMHVIYPFGEKDIKDFLFCQKILKYATEKVGYGKLDFSLFSKKATVIISDFLDNKKILKKLLSDLGFNMVSFVSKSICDFSSQKLDSRSKIRPAIMSVNFGSTEFFFLKEGVCLFSKQFEFGLKRIQSVYSDYFKNKYSLLVSFEKLDEIISYLSEGQYLGSKKIDVSGYSVNYDRPYGKKVALVELSEVIEPIIKSFVLELKNYITLLPPEVLIDIQKQGIYLTGQGAKLHGFNTLVVRILRQNIRISQLPEISTILGAKEVQ